MWKFLPTANTIELNDYPDIKEAWHKLINFYFERNIVGKPGDQAISALEELRAWGRSDSDLRFYNPVNSDRTSGATKATVFWKALPTSFDSHFGDDKDALYEFLDKHQRYDADVPSTRIQDEYCEWSVRKNNEDKITRILFTSEPPEFYESLFYDYFEVGTDQTHALLLELYKSRCDDQEITIDELKDSRGNYDRYNKWNNEYCVHMQQPDNTLGAQINIAARSSILRMDTRTNSIISDADELINCGLYGARSRQSDPSIGAAINSEVRANNFVTLENPVGLYMTDFDPDGISSPDGTDASEFWKVLKGEASENKEDSMIVRAEFTVPKEKGYTVSDLDIGGENIIYGAQIAAKIGVRVSALATPAGDQAKVPRAIGCRNERPFPLDPNIPATRNRGQN